MSDRIVVMEAGRIVQIGAPAELYERPETPYVANFVGSSNMIMGSVAGVTGDTALVRFDGTEIRAMMRGAAIVVGDTVTISIRPEKVKLHQGSEGESGISDNANTLRGKLRDKFFHGESVRLAIDIGSDQLFFVHRQLEDGLNQMALPEIGADVTLGVNAANIILFAGAREVLPDADA
jgi:ABC-type Fe3+/spermidine/putrescine transport system ATPase subunit